MTTAPWTTSATPRLLAGWRETGRPAPLAEHLGRFGPLPADRFRGQPAEPVDVVARAGLTGRGGAGFPTAKKLEAVAAAGAPAVVVANGVESEPASRKDETLLFMAPHLVLDGMALAAAALDADTIHLCVGDDQRALAEHLAAAVAERAARGVDRVRAEIGLLPHRYVASEETSLVRWLNGGDALPLSRPPRPFERGVGRRPTFVSNVETFAHLALIARSGARWFRAAGTADAPGTLLTTISGAVTEPGVYEVEHGSRVIDVLRAAGVSGLSGTLLIGGYQGSWHPLVSVANLPLSAHGLRRVGGSPGAGVLVLLPAAACGLLETAHVLKYLAGESAGQCGPCVLGLAAVADDFEELATGHTTDELLDQLQRRLRLVAGRGACHHPDGATRMARSALITFADEVDAHLRWGQCAAAEHGVDARHLLPVRVSERGAR